MRAGVRYRKRPHLDNPLPLIVAAAAIGAMLGFYTSYMQRETGPIGTYGGTTQESAGTVPESPPGVGSTAPEGGGFQ